MNCLEVSKLKQTGFRQGDALSSFFNPALEKVNRSSAFPLRQSIEIFDQNTISADDIIIIGSYRNRVKMRTN